jgi:hypothetical protein
MAACVAPPGIKGIAGPHKENACAVVGQRSTRSALMLRQLLNDQVGSRVPTYGRSGYRRTTMAAGRLPRHVACEDTSSLPQNARIATEEDRRKPYLLTIGQNVRFILKRSR